MSTTPLLEYFYCYSLNLHWILVTVCHRSVYRHSPWSNSQATEETGNTRPGQARMRNSWGFTLYCVQKMGEHGCMCAGPWTHLSFSAAGKAQQLSCYFIHLGISLVREAYQSLQCLLLQQRLPGRQVGLQTAEGILESVDSSSDAQPMNR